MEEKTGVDFRKIRRKDRVWDDDAAWQLLSGSEYGILSMCGTDGYGYGIPISYALSGDSIYFHCALKGYKLDCIAANDRVSFCVVGRTQVIPEKFSTAYQSVLVFGRIAGGLSESERRQALGLLADKYSPAFKAASEAYTDRLFPCTNVLRLDISHISGKCNPIRKEK